MGLTVAQCIHGLGLGGAQKVIASIVRGRSPGIEHIVYSCEDGVLADEVRAAGADIRIIPRQIPKWDHAWMRRTAKAFVEDGVDVVHGHLFGDTLHGYFASRRASNLPFLMTLHNDYESFSRIQKMGYSYLLKRASHSVGCSDFVQRTFAQHSAVNGRLTSIVNGVEVPEPPRGAPKALLVELGVDPSKPVLMAFGRLSEQKGFQVLVKALAAMERNDVQLVLVGEGDLEDAIRARARELGLEDRVILAGFRDDVGDLMYAADIVAFPSLWEGLPIALIEAMARGRCLVTSALPGIMEAVRHEEEALVVPPGDAGALADALDRIVSDPELQKSLAAQAQARFHERFTASSMVHAYEAIYRRLAESREVA